MLKQMMPVTAMMKDMHQVMLRPSMMLMNEMNLTAQSRLLEWATAPLVQLTLKEWGSALQMQEWAIAPLTLMMPTIAHSIWPLHTA